jgi:ABC-type Fe3+/spermidine/putrescine transport system ATPase subunit
VVADPDWKPAEGAEAVLSIRPESWIFSEESAAVNAVRGEIRDSTYLGELAQYEFQAGSQKFKVVEMNPHLSGRENGHVFFAKVNSDDVVILKP